MISPGSASHQAGILIIVFLYFVFASLQRYLLSPATRHEGLTFGSLAVPVFHHPQLFGTYLVRVFHYSQVFGTNWYYLVLVWYLCFLFSTIDAMHCQYPKLSLEQITDLLKYLQNVSVHQTISYLFSQVSSRINLHTYLKFDFSCWQCLQCSIVHYN